MVSNYAAIDLDEKVTLRFLEAARLAKQQLGSCNGYFRVLYVVEHRHLSNVTADLHALYMALGAEHVIAIGPADFSVTFGSEWENVLEKEKMGLESRSWGWIHSDAPELVW